MEVGEKEVVFLLEKNGQTRSETTVRIWAADAKPAPLAAIDIHSRVAFSSRATQSAPEGRGKPSFLSLTLSF